MHAYTCTSKQIFIYLLPQLILTASNAAPQAGLDILNTEPPGAKTAFYVTFASI